VALLSVLLAASVAVALLADDLAWQEMVDRFHGEGEWATVTAGVLTVRAGASTESEIIDVLVEGQRVAVVGEADGGFVPVRIEGRQAWVAGAYLTANGNPLSRTAPAAAAASHLDDASPPVPGPTGPPVIASEPPVPDHAPSSSGLPDQEPERWIDIDRGTATVTLFMGDTPLASYPGRIGRDPSADGFYATAIGTYHVYSMHKGLSPTPFAEDTYLTDWVGFDPERRNGIHSPVRDAAGNVRDWQNPTTLGCVRLGAEDAAAVFAFAEPGMRVEVHD
jgi:hypothetical protein